MSTQLKHRTKLSAVDGREHTVEPVCPDRVVRFRPSYSLFFIPCRTVCSCVSSSSYCFLEYLDSIYITLQVALAPLPPPVPEKKKSSRPHSVSCYRVRTHTNNIQKWVAYSIRASPVVFDMHCIGRGKQCDRRGEIDVKSIRIFFYVPVTVSVDGPKVSCPLARHGWRGAQRLGSCHQ